MGWQFVLQVFVTGVLWKTLGRFWCEKTRGNDSSWGVQRAPAHTVLFFQESDIKWASRWDTYLTMSDVQIHWFSIINSVVVVFFLSGE